MLWQGRTKTRTSSRHVAIAQAALGIALCLWAGAAAAVPTAAPGFVQLPTIATANPTSGGVVAAGGSVFVGQDAFGLQSGVRIDPGDTLYAIETPFATPGVAPDASALELAPTGTTPFIADIALDPTDATGATFFISQAAGPPKGLRHRAPARSALRAARKRDRNGQCSALLAPPSLDHR